MDGSEARVATMSEYDVQMASTGSANEAPGDYSKRMRDKKIMLAQYPGPDAKRFYSWTNGPLAKHLANKDMAQQNKPPAPCSVLFWPVLEHPQNRRVLSVLPPLTFFSGGRRRRGRGREGPPAPGLVSFRGLCHSPRRAQEKIQKISEVASPTKYLLC